MPRRYLPERGDVVWLQFNPQRGREQAGRRPAVILSPGAYNRRASLALICPVTSSVKGYPFEFVLPEGLAIHGAVLCDQVRSLDWLAREAELISRLPVEIVEQVLAKALVLLR